MKIRKAEEKDLSAMFELHKQFIEKMSKLRPNRYALHDDEEEVFTKKTKKRIDSPQAHVIIAEDNNEILGFAIGIIEENPSFCKERKCGNAHYAVVKEGHQNKGIGTELIEDMISFFKNQGITQIEATLDSLNEQSKSYLNKNGFKTEVKIMIKDI